MNACRRKALLTAATIAKARPGTKIITFGTTAALERPIGENESVFDWVEDIDNSCRRDGMTNLATAFELMVEQNIKADRLFIVSDCAINNGNTISAFNNWSESLGFKTAYCIDMGAYGTSPLKHSQMAFISGYGNQMFEAVKHLEFDGTTVISEIRKIRFGKNG
jgi:hypothetical protein